MTRRDSTSLSTSTSRPSRYALARRGGAGSDPGSKRLPACLQLHLSLSLGSSSDHSGQDAAAAVQSLNLLLKSIGATLTDVDDLVFK